MVSVQNTVDTGHDDMVHDAQMDYYGTKLATCFSDRSMNLRNNINYQLMCWILHKIWLSFNFLTLLFSPPPLHRNIVLLSWPLGNKCIVHSMFPVVLPPGT